MSKRSRAATPSSKEDASAKEAKRSLAEFVREKGLHGSKIRDRVVDVFFSADEHLDLEGLLERVRKEDPGVGMATVYRTIKLLEEAGLAEGSTFGRGTTMFEPTLGRAHHDHLICQGCGLIVEFVSDAIERLQIKVARDHGFELRAHRHELFGLCADCQQRETKRRSPA